MAFKGYLGCRFKPAGCFWPCIITGVCYVIFYVFFFANVTGVTAGARNKPRGHKVPTPPPPPLPPPPSSPAPPCDLRRGPTVRLGFRLTFNLDFTALKAQGLEREFVLGSREALATVFQVPCGAGDPSNMGAPIFIRDVSAVAFPGAATSAATAVRLDFDVDVAV